MRYKKILIFFLTCVAILPFVFPFYWMIKSSIESTEALFSSPTHLFPSSFTLKSYRELLSQTDFMVYITNSILIATGCMILNTILSCLAGYGLTRYSFWGRKIFARGTLFAYMFPPMLLGIPFFLLFHKIGLLNTYAGIIIAQATISLPFSIWLMWQFFQTVPMSYEESAWVCGASRFRTFVDVSLPLALPGIIAICLFSFALSWSDYTFSLIILTRDSMKTLPVGLDFIMDRPSVHWGMMQAASVLVCAPGFILVLFLQRYLMAGFGVGGLKG